MLHPFAGLYGMERDRAIVGEDAWCGPDTELPHATWVHIATYEKDPEDGDGQQCEIHVTAWPARFYRLVVHPSPNSVGNAGRPFVLSTGSGSECLEHLVATAQRVTRGMLGADAYPPQDDYDNPRARRVREAIEHLRQARELLKQAGAPKATERVRLALTSAGGALRHAELAPIREQRQIEETSS